jgi:hypothetical protein
MEIKHMAQLSSPGVSVTVIDESFYTPAAPGTVPLIVVASAENKQNGAGTGIAPGTLAANAGTVYLLTSQKDLSDTFGIPKFYTDSNNNPIHAGEQNEYGLEAAYSFLGVSNRAYVVRADLDLDQLTGKAEAPTGAPADGTYWFATADTKFGVNQYNADTGTFGTENVRYPTIITDVNQLVAADPMEAPANSVGANGEYALVATTSLNRLYYKKVLTNTAAGTWVKVGTGAWKASWPAATGNIVSPTLLVGDEIVINGITVTGVESVAALATAINSANISSSAVKAAAISGFLNLYSTGIDIVISGSTVAKVGLSSTTYIAPVLQISKHTQVPTFDADNAPTGSIWVKTTKPNQGADYIIKKYSSTTGAFVEQAVSLYPTAAQALNGLDPLTGGLGLAIGTVYVKTNDAESTNEADFKIYARSGVGPTVVTSIAITTARNFTAGTNVFQLDVSRAGSNTYTNVTVTFTAGTDPVQNVNSLLDQLHSQLTGLPVTATRTTTNQIVISHTDGGDIKFTDGTGTPINQLFAAGTTTNFYADPAGVADGVASLWTESFDITSSDTAPTSTPTDGTLWYNTMIDEVDIMVHNGTIWKGYSSVAGSNTTGPIVSATRPTLQSDGTPLVNGDLWISTADLENFPLIYKFNFTTKKWVLLDNADQTTQNGVLFADARWNTTGEGPDASPITDLLASDFVDFDCPDPALYPSGTLLWNLRRSGFNVKRYQEDYVDVLARNVRFGDEVMTDYYPARWVSYAANQVNGAGSFGRKAVRQVVLAALNAEINGNTDLRDEESRIFNLMACPGYPEAITSLVSLNYDRGLTAFVVGDTPARLTPDATTLSNWGNNTANATVNGDDGLITTDAYLGVFYPWGYTTDLLGNNIVVPPSHMMLRTIALSDNVSYPWFAPAGTRRGGITNVSSVGYIDPLTGEFNATALNTGQRDTLASIHVNPITFITGTGLVNYGQYTRQLSASALDRINVARLVIYLRRQFSQLAKPYVFEPNDTITRNEIKQAAESLLLELVGQRALYDYLVVCDTSNNTPARIDRSELYLDVAIEPVKAVEFIYIPLRLKNTGEIAGL